MNTGVIKEVLRGKKKARKKRKVVEEAGKGAMLKNCVSYPPGGRILPKNTLSRRNCIKRGGHRQKRKKLLSGAGRVRTEGSHNSIARRGGKKHEGKNVED